MNYSTENNKRRKRRANNKSKRVVNKVAIYVFRTFVIALLVGGFALAGTLVGAYMGILENAPKLGDVQELSMDFTTLIYDSNGVEMARIAGAENREYATSDRIPQHVKDAFVSIEDERFYTHDGVDYQGFVRAMWENLKSINDENATTQGASTITQQLIKNKLGLTRNTVETKLQEQYLALKYEEELIALFDGPSEEVRARAKDYILELYLNVIGFDESKFGVQTAALYYFGKDISEVTLEEGCILAAIIQNPYHNNPFRDPIKNSRRANTALDNMLDQGYITQEQYDNADLDAAYANVLSTKQAAAEQSSMHSYYVDQVITEVRNDLMAKFNLSGPEASNWIFQGGLEIFTNLEPRIQDIVDEAYASDEWFPASEFKIEVEYTLSTRNSLTGLLTHHPTKRKLVDSMDDVAACIEQFKDELLGVDDVIEGERHYAIPQPQGSFAIIDQYTGKVLAISGGRGEKLTNRGFNRATVAERQPGSVFKVLASFVPALDMGLITPGTIIDDVPYVYPSHNNYAPTNWYNSYRGMSTVRLGIRDSMNVITVKNMYDTGIETSFNYLLNFGFTTLRPEDGYGLSTALGGITTGVTSVETAAAYAAIANGGTYIEPTFYSKVLDHNGNVLLEKVPETYTVIKSTTAYLTTDMMKDVVTSGTGTSARFQNVRMPVAGKTGTTSNTYDLTFAGYTPYYTAAVWLGFDTPRAMRNNGTDANMHTRIWRHIMEQIHVGLEYKDFERPSGITSARICTVSGQLAADGFCDHDPRGSRVRNEIFASGTAPTVYCTLHQTFTVCDHSGKLPNEGCPSDSVSTKIGFVRYIPFDGPEGVADRAYEVPRGVQEGLVCDYHSPDSSSNYPEIPFDPDNPDIITVPPQPIFTEPPSDSGSTPAPDAEPQNPVPEGPLMDTP